jgi:hypothetical protein
MCLGVFGLTKGQKYEIIFIFGNVTGIVSENKNVSENVSEEIFIVLLLFDLTLD